MRKWTSLVLGSYREYSCLSTRWKAAHFPRRAGLPTITNVSRCQVQIPISYPKGRSLQQLQEENLQFPTQEPVCGYWRIIIRSVRTEVQTGNLLLHTLLTCIGILYLWPSVRWIIDNFLLWCALLSSPCQLQAIHANQKEEMNMLEEELTAHRELITVLQRQVDVLQRYKVTQWVAQN